MGGAPGAWRAAHFCFKHFRKIILILNPHQCGNFADAAFGILQKQRGGLHPPFFDVARDADAEILLGNLKQAAAADIKDAAQLCGFKAELAKLIDSQKDSLRFYNLGNSFHSKVEHIGVQGGYRPDDVLML